MLEEIHSKPFEKWFARLKDREAIDRINAKIFQTQVVESFVGDCKMVGGGVTEMRFHFGPGYRVYAAIDSGRLLLLLHGGEKARQSSDIERAKAIYHQWRERHVL